MIIKTLTILFCGLIMGFLVELIFRSIKNKKITKPLFINYQMYGLSGLFLFLLYNLQINILFKIILMVLFTTGIEFITGYLYLKIKNKYLWKYKHKFNYKKLICPLFSFYWLCVSLFAYYFIIPQILKIF